MNIKSSERHLCSVLYICWSIYLLIPGSCIVGSVIFSDEYKAHQGNFRYIRGKSWKNQGIRKWKSGGLPELSPKVSLIISNVKIHFLDYMLFLKMTTISVPNSRVNTSFIIPRGPRVKLNGIYFGNIKAVVFHLTTYELIIPILWKYI